MTDQQGKGAANPRIFHPDLVPPAPAQEPTPEPSPEPVANPPEGRIRVGGREQTVEEVVANYEQSTQEALRLRQELMQERIQREAEKRVAEERIRQMQHVEPPKPQWVEGFDPEALDADTLRDAIRAEAQGLFTQMLQEAMAPYAKLGAESAKIRKQDPEFDPQRAQEYLTDPDDLQLYNDLMQTAPDAALRFAWKAAKAAQTVQKTEVSVDRAAQAAASAAPQRPSIPSPSATDRKKEVADALKHAYETGDWENFYRVRARGTSIDRRVEVGRPAE